MKYSINGASVMLLEDETLVAGSVGVHFVDFVFDDTWDEYTVKMAVFKSDYDEREMLIEDSRCLIPWEVLQEAGVLHVGIYGESSEKKRPTLWAAPKTVYPGVSPCESSVEPTPNKWQQAIAYIESLVSPTVEVMAIDGGHRLAVTDVDGTHFFYVMDGTDGAKGEDGKDGADGKDGTDGIDGVNGVDGKSAYEIAVDDGYKGTEAEWIASLKGADGKDGTNGVDGEKGDKGDKGDPYTLTEEDKAEIVTSVLEELPEESEVYVGEDEPTDPNVKLWVNLDKTTESTIPDHWLSALEDGAKSINQALCTAGANKSAFLFYSDSHWNYGSQMSPKLLKYLYEHTGMTKTFFGGDIVNDEATDYDAMSYLWDWRNMLKGLPNHHSVVGNHDDGTSTDNLFSEQYVYGYLLSAEETPDIVRGKGGMYYYIDNSPEKTRYIFLDTAYKGVGSDQQDFVKGALLSTPEGWHIVAISHIWYDTDWTDSSNPVVGDLNNGASTILAMFDAYNSRSGAYTECGGWVEFCVGGHTHWDFDGASTTGIPIILVETDSKHTRSGLTYTEGTTTESSVNGIVADYDSHKIYIVRIGRGESREVEITNYVVSYTNVLPLALAADGVSIYNADDTPGYKADTRWSNSSVAEATSSGIYLTGYIPISAGDTVYLENIIMPNSTGNDCVVFFWEDDISGAYKSAQNGTNLTTYNSAVWGDDGNLKQFTIPTNSTSKYMRIQCGGIDATSVITINEPIE